MPVSALPKVVKALEWHGKQILAEIRRAEVRGAAWVMARAARDAKRNHPGWIRRSGDAERSVKRQSLKWIGPGRLDATWGSKLFYVLWLEKDHGGFLRNAADRWHPRLADAIRHFYNNPEAGPPKS